MEWRVTLRSLVFCICPYVFGWFDVALKGRWAAIDEQGIFEAPLSRKTFLDYARLLRDNILDAMDSLIVSCDNRMLQYQSIIVL